MNIVYNPSFLKKLKRLNVRIRKSVKERMILFAKNPYELRLDNHPLRDNYQGYRSIDITSDYRAIYKETRIRDEVVAYFIALGTHEELYGKGVGFKTKY